MRLGRFVSRLAYGLVVAGLAAPAVLLTLARASGVDRGAVIRLVAFTPLAIPLYAALLVLLLAGWLVVRRARRGSEDARRPLVAPLAALVAAVGLGLHLWWFSPQLLGSAPAVAAGARTTVVMNANLYYGTGEAVQVVAAVKRYHVDILATEEISPRELDRLHAAGLSQVLPYEAGRADPQVSGTMVFADQPISDVTDLHTQFQSYEMTVGSLRLIAAHPLSPEYPAGWRSDHDIIRTAAVADNVDMIVGDLNATPDHTVLRELGDAGYRDVAEEANQGWQPTWPANHLGVPFFVPPLVRIDHVLVTSTYAGVGTSTVHIDHTDHLALVARIAPAAR